jgi:acetyltransferase-like isoleucine patch superfamily enzyme
MKPLRTHLEHDWYSLGIPANVQLGRKVQIDTSYGFPPFLSQRQPGLIMGDASGAYDGSTFYVSPNGLVTVGAYTCLNSTSIVCHQRIVIGAHCLLAWGAVILDAWCPESISAMGRRRVLECAATHADRYLMAVGEPRPVMIEDNVWVGFDSVVMPGVTLGRGCVIGCKSVVTADVPPYAVAVGNPIRIVRYLTADDTEAAREGALAEYARYE